MVERARTAALRSVQAGYATIAAAYASQLSGELAGKPLDRALLDVFAESTRGAGPVLEVGCGPGHVGAYLRDRGVEIEGLDLSPEMIAEARRLHPEMRLSVGDMGALDRADGAFAGIVAFYAIVHIPTEDLDAPFRELGRVLRPDGRMILAFHAGSEMKHVDELWGRPTSLDFWFHPPDAVVAALSRAGFSIEARLDRAPYADVEHRSSRTYLLARLRSR